MSDGARDFQCFFFGSDQRAARLEAHRFYMEQAETRLLSQFEHIGDDARRAADEWEARSRPWVDPDVHDPASFYEEAFDVEVNHFSMLTDLWNQTRLSVVAGLYFAWEKQVRDLLLSEVGRWCPEPKVADAIWHEPTNGIVEFMVGLNLIPSGEPCLGKLDECRLVVNVYKHGGGSSLRELVSAHPEYLARSMGAVDAHAMEYQPYLFRYLQVDEPQIYAFSEAVVAFWERLVERRFASEVGNLPRWFRVACRGATSCGDQWGSYE